MQDSMIAIPIPAILVLGFLVGIILLLLGYRENTDPTKRQHRMGLGIIIIGIMIPITPASWYGYLIVTSGLILGLIEIAIIAVTLLIGIVLLYLGVKTFSKS